MLLALCISPSHCTFQALCYARSLGVCSATTCMPTVLHLSCTRDAFVLDASFNSTKRGADSSLLRQSRAALQLQSNLIALCRRRISFFTQSTDLGLHVFSQTILPRKIFSFIAFNLLHNSPSAGTQRRFER